MADEMVNELLDKAGIKAIPEIQKKEETQTPPKSSADIEKDAEESEQEGTEENEKISQKDDKVDEEIDVSDEPDQKDSNEDDLPKGVKKRIGKLTKRFKEAEEKLLQKEKQLEELNQLLISIEKKTVEEPKKLEQEKKFQLPIEEQKELVLDKALTKLLEKEKELPIEKRNILSDEEANDLLIDNPVAYDRYQRRNHDFVSKLRKSIDDEYSGEKELPKSFESDKQRQENYENFVKEYPELDFVDTLKIIAKKVDISDDKLLLEEMSKKDAELGKFFAFMKENNVKYKDSKLEVAAKDYYKQKEKTALSELQEQNKKLEAELNRLKGLDVGIGSTTKVVSKGKTADEKNMDDYVKSLVARAGIK